MIFRPPFLPRLGAACSATLWFVMISLLRGLWIPVFLLFPFSVTSTADSLTGANRLTYLDADDPFYAGLSLPRLTTPQWVGEPDVEAVVILAIDDLREPQKYETYLRSILNRLKEIDGRAPVSIYCNSFDPSHPQFQEWLKEGLSLEVHTLTHPCPLLADNDFKTAANVVHKDVELLNQIERNRAVAYRMPCCDSINSPSPRFYAEIFNRTSESGQFMTIDSSVMNITTAEDSSLPRRLTVDADGRGRFRKYVPFPSFSTTITDYPYPYVIGKLCWEFPAMAPSDWEAQNLHGVNNPITLNDWEAALDVTVLKQGVFTFVFHPHGWIRPDQMVEFIDYAVKTYGTKVKFLTFREAEERINRHLLGGNPLRRHKGQDNGVRLIDLNDDGFMDVVIGNERTRKTRIWNPGQDEWIDSSFPVSLVEADDVRGVREAGARFGIVRSDKRVSLLQRTEQFSGAWTFDGTHWKEDRALLSGLRIDGKAVLTSRSGKDQGVRFRDVDGDGSCEVFVSNTNQNGLLSWDTDQDSWTKNSFALPDGTSLVDGDGRDNGLRFVDINADGYDDVLQSNQQAYSLHLFVPEPFLGFKGGWTRLVREGKRGDVNEIPMIVRGGEHSNNGAWFKSRHLWVQNEDTAKLPDLVDRRSYDDLLAGVQPPAKSPDESLQCIQVRGEFEVELVAHEPAVQDPIAFEWGADGKLWVVEMGDYPLGIDGAGKPGGIVRFLEDSNNDGKYEKSTVFLDGLSFPTGVMPWGRGVLVSAAPEIFYAEDTDGDGGADLRKVLFSGFGEGNQQHRVNGFEYGLDNWVYGANGDSGGEIRTVGGLFSESSSAVLDSKEAVNIRGRDFRFRPNEGLFETVAGQTQFGRHRDDWGNWFGNNNPSWGWHYYFPERYLARNPHLALRSLKRYFSDSPNSTRVFAVSRALQRFNHVGTMNHVTSGASVTPYRDTLFGKQFENSVFISEPVYNVVHRENFESVGVSFVGHRAPDAENREFLASTDTWFRPIMLKTGPDGALYIADMYRLVLEHPEWIPKDVQKRFDLRAGSEKGRIYRVFPKNAALRKAPRLDQLDVGELVKALNSPNGWQRDTVQRLLVEKADRSIATVLKRAGALSPNPKVRLQVLYTLDGLGALTTDLLAMALADRHPSVREHAIRLSEAHLRKAGAFRTATNSQPIGFGRLAEQLLSRVADPNLRVRYQLAFSLGEWSDPRAARALAALIVRNAGNLDIEKAVLSSALPHVEGILDVMNAGSGKSFPVSFLKGVFRFAAILNDETVVLKALNRLTAKDDRFGPEQRFAALEGFLDGQDRGNGSLERFQSDGSRELRQSAERVETLFALARDVALNDSRPVDERVAAIRVLGRGTSGREEDLKALADLLAPRNSDYLQKVGLKSLVKSYTSLGGRVLIQGWGTYGPAIRDEVLDALLSRSEWVDLLLDEIEAEKIAVGQIGAVHRQRLLGHGRSEIRERARAVFSSQLGRSTVSESLQKVGQMRGNSCQGALLYRQQCMVCHRFREEGNEVGPNLETVSDKSVQALLIAILKPNEAIESKFVNYSAVTLAGEEISGVIVAETPNSISIRTALGTEETLLRSELEALTSSGISLMPEGFEEILQPQGLADVIAYLTESEREGT